MAGQQQILQQLAEEEPKVRPWLSGRRAAGRQRAGWPGSPTMLLLLLQLLAQLAQECQEQRERLPQEIRWSLLGETPEGLGDGHLVACASNGHAPGSGGHLSGADSESQEENTKL